MPSEPSSVVPSSTTSCAGALQAKAERARKATAYLVNIDVTPMELLQVRSTGDWPRSFAVFLAERRNLKANPRWGRSEVPPLKRVSGIAATVREDLVSQFPDAHPL